MSLRIQDQYILPFFIFPLHSRYFSFTNPSLRIQRQEFKNETVIKNSRSFFIFLLHSRYFSFRNEPIIKNSRTNPSSRIQDKGTRLRECKTGTKNERVMSLIIKNVYIV